MPSFCITVVSLTAVDDRQCRVAKARAENAAFFELMASTSQKTVIRRDGCCRPIPLLFAPVILVTALVVVWPGWLRTAQAQLWVSEKGGGLGHTAVTLNKSRTLRFDVSVFDQSMKLIGVLDVRSRSTLTTCSRRFAPSQAAVASASAAATARPCLAASLGTP